MNKNVRTDLAVESRDLWRRSAGADLPGVDARAEERDGIPVQVVEIRDPAAAEKLCKPMGRYVTVGLDPLIRRETGAFYRACGVLAREIRAGLPPDGGVLVVCLGNPDVTPDAVGPLCAGQVLVTAHLKRAMPEEFAALRSVSVLRTGVLGTTGVESARLTAAAAELVRPAGIVAVDALAAREASRLCRAVQVTDAGIVPGSGVGNARSALNRETMGVPVVAVGVPTVVDAASLCAELTETDAPPAGSEDMFVTPRDIDARVREAARLVARAVNLALHPALTPEELEELQS